MIEAKQMEHVLPLMPEAARCRLCGAESTRVPRQLGVCAVCLRADPDRALPLAQAAHRRARRLFGLPEEPPQSAGGIPCSLCVHTCRMAEGERGYCNLRENRGGRTAVLAGNPEGGVLPELALHGERGDCDARISARHQCGVKTKVLKPDPKWTMALAQRRDLPGSASQ